MKNKTKQGNLPECILTEFSVLFFSKKYNMMSFSILKSFCGIFMVYGWLGQINRGGDYKSNVTSHNFLQQSNGGSKLEKLCFIPKRISRVFNIYIPRGNGRGS